jgi:hypothetical protein
MSTSGYTALAAIDSALRQQPKDICACTDASNEYDNEDKKDCKLLVALSSRDLIKMLSISTPVF